LHPVADSETLCAMSPGPIPYIERTRRYYAALGYDLPYRWAEHADVPFARLAQPLGRSRIALVTTASPIATARRDYDAAAKFFTVYSGDTAEIAAAEHALTINHVAIDFAHTTGEDPGSYFPLRAMRRAEGAGRIGAVAARFHGVPTNRSRRTTVETDAPEILARCKADGADAAILVPNCPVCHQTVSLVARHLEAHGIATAILGCAKDIVELCGVPRFVFSDFPLGNAAGRPHDIASQDLTLGLAFDLLERAAAPRTTVQSPLSWSQEETWKRDYGNVEGLAPAAIARLRAEFEAGKAIARQRRTT
jgi:D-proline reductase (dithiol) PrdB